MGEKILIVEDELSVREGLIEALTGEGYDPCGVETGEESLKKFQEERWDLCILDVKLPGESGFEVCRKLRETCRIFHQTLILVTHDLQIARMADEVLTLEDGSLLTEENR